MMKSVDPLQLNGEGSGAHEYYCETVLKVSWAKAAEGGVELKEHGGMIRILVQTHKNIGYTHKKS